MFNKHSSNTKDHCKKITDAIFAQLPLKAINDGNVVAKLFLLYDKLLFLLGLGKNFKADLIRGI